MKRKMSNEETDQRDPAVVAAQEAAAAEDAGHSNEDIKQEPASEEAPPEAKEPSKYLCGCEQGVKLVRNAGGTLVCEPHGAQVTVADGGIEMKPADPPANGADLKEPDVETVLEGMIDGIASEITKLTLKEVARRLGKDEEKYDRGECRARVLDKVGVKLRTESENVRRKIRQQVSQLKLPVNHSHTRNPLMMGRGRKKKDDPAPAERRATRE